MARNAEMAARIEAAAGAGPLTFVVAGDSGAWPDPTADAILAALLGQAAALSPAFFANLGDFAGPGTPERHAHYLRLVEALPCPDVCVVGNHDLDDPGGRAAWTAVHGPAEFTFAAGHTRFVALDAAPTGDARGHGGAGRRGAGVPGPDAGRRRRAAPGRAHALPAARRRPLRPAPAVGLLLREREFLGLLREHRVGLVCCAHALFFDTWVQDGTRFVVSGGGGTALCSHFRGVCAPGDGVPAERGALFHAVALTVGADGAVGGRVLQAFDAPGRARIAFG